MKKEEEENDENSIFEFRKKLESLADIWPLISKQSRFMAYFKAVRGLPKEYIDEIIDDFIENSKQMPLPNDFKKAKFEYFRKTSGKYNSQEKEEQSLCLDCYNTGFMFCKKNEKESQQLCLCHCENSKREINFYGDLIKFMPRWDNEKMESVYEFVKCRFPYEAFKPSPNKINEKSLNELAQRWKAKIIKSAEYWSK